MPTVTTIPQDPLLLMGIQYHGQWAYLVLAGEKPALPPGWNMISKANVHFTGDARYFPLSLIQESSGQPAEVVDAHEGQTPAHEWQLRHDPLEQVQHVGDADLYLSRYVSVNLQEGDWQVSVDATDLPQEEGHA